MLKKGFKERQSLKVNFEKNNYQVYHTRKTE